MEHKSTVLIVDDDPSARDTLAALLFGEDYDLALASDGLEALAKAAELRPDLILLDVMMPGMDGFEVCRRLRADPRLAEVPVIMVTALDDRDSRLRGLEAGADDFVSKPFDRLELRARVRTITRLNRYRRLLVERTQRQRAEEALGESEERYRNLFEGVPVGLYQTTPEGKILDANPALVEILGYPDRETLMVANAIDRYVNAEDRAQWQLLIEREGAVSGFEVQWRRHDGATIWVRESARATRDADGQVVYYDGAVEDITARRQAEEALRRAHDELERRVEERTAELAKANKELLSEIAQRKQAEEALRCSLEETAHAQRTLLALSQAAQSVQRARTPEEVYRTVGDEVANLGYHAAIFTLTDDRTHLVSSHLTFEPAAVRAAEKLAGLSMQDLRLPLVPGGFYQRIIAEGEATFSESFAEPMAEALAGPPRPLAGRLAALLGIEQGIVAPLTVGGETHGLLMVTGTDVTKADVPAITAFANQAATAIENARLFEQVQAGRERLRRLTQQVVWAQEEERRRLSRELHDEAGQALTALKISLDLIRSDLPVEAGSLRQRLSEAITLTETTMDQVRLLAHGLRPPALDTVGLNYTLEGLCLDFAERTQLSIDYAGAELPVPLEAVDICLYRLLQEALTNVAKHAHANQAWVALRYDGETVSLSVEDDGQGFDKQARMSVGIGVLGMQERLELLGGQLEIESRLGQGTRLTARVPLEKAYVERRTAGDSRNPR